MTDTAAAPITSPVKAHRCGIISLPVKGDVVATLAAVSLDPTSLSFAGQKVGTGSTPQVVTLTNSGNADLTITGVTLAGTIYPGDWPMTIRAVYRSRIRSFGDQTLFFHWDYLSEKGMGGRSDGIGIDGGIELFEDKGEGGAGETECSQRNQDPPSHSHDRRHRGRTPLQVPSSRHTIPRRRRTGFGPCRSPLAIPACPEPRSPPCSPPSPRS